jgi:DNA-binding LacI/PurR family transcriptional regulator
MGDWVLEREVSPGPLAAYRRVEQDLRARIASGQWTSGTNLPNRRRLAREYGVAVNTVQRAMAALLADGTLSSHGRHGTRVGATHGPRSSPLSNLPSVNGSPLISNRDRSVAVANLAVISALDRDIHGDPTSGLSWAGAVLRSFEHVINQSGGRTYFLNVMYPCGETYPTVAAAVNAALAKQVDGLAVINVNEYPTWLDELHGALETERLPVAYISGNEDDCWFTHLYYRQRHSGYLAAQHLMKSGYRKLLFVTPYTARWVVDRVAGVREAVRLAGWPDDSFLQRPVQPQMHALGYFNLPLEKRTQCLQQALREGLDAVGGGGERIGIIAPNDEAACDLLPLLAERGLAIGSQAGVIGFDDGLRAHLVGLSSVRPPMNEMGAAAADLLLRALRGERPLWQVCLAAQVMPRATTGPTSMPVSVPQMA